MASAFWTVHSELPREGPGDGASLERAWVSAGGQSDWHVCDAACGPGADVADLARLAGQVTAFDGHQDFVDSAMARHASLKNAAIHRGDLSAIGDYAPEGGFDMVWIAGALYFLGVEAGLGLFKSALKPNGVVAFSEPCVFDAEHSDVAAFWEGYPAGTVEDIHRSVQNAGYEVLDSFPLSDAAWEAYYQPMDARLEMLRPNADDELKQAIDAAAKEAVDWRRLRRATGYQVVVARVI